MDAPDPDSFDSTCIVIVVSVGTDVTINFSSSKSAEVKLEFVFGVKFANNDDLFYYDAKELVVLNESR